MPYTRVVLVDVLWPITKLQSLSLYLHMSVLGAFGGPTTSLPRGPGPPEHAGGRGPNVTQVSDTHSAGYFLAYIVVVLSIIRERDSSSKREEMERREIHVCDCALLCLSMRKKTTTAPEAAHIGLGIGAKANNCCLFLPSFLPAGQHTHTRQWREMALCVVRLGCV